MAQRGHRAYAQLGPVWGASGVEVEPKTGPMRATMGFCTNPCQSQKNVGNRGKDASLQLSPNLGLGCSAHKFRYLGAKRCGGPPPTCPIWAQSDPDGPQIEAMWCTWTPRSRVTLRNLGPLIWRQLHTKLGPTETQHGEHSFKRSVINSQKTRKILKSKRAFWGFRIGQAMPPISKE